MDDNEGDGTAAEAKWMASTEKDKLMKSTREVIVNQMIDERKTNLSKIEVLKQNCKTKDDEITNLKDEVKNLNDTNQNSTDMINKLNDEIKDLKIANQTANDKVVQMSTDLGKAQNDLLLEKDLSSTLMSRLDNPIINTPSVRPSVLFITEETLIFDLLDSSQVEWIYRNVDNLEALEVSLDKSELKKEIHNCDLVVVMVGRCDILAEGDGIKMLFTVNRIVSKLNELCTPFRFVQVLPVKGPKYRTDLTLFNRRLITKPEVSPINISGIFDHLNDFDIYVKAKITIQKHLLQNVASEICKQVGVPEIREKPNEPPSGGSDDEQNDEIIEFLPLYKKHTGAIIGELGETQKKIQDISGARVSVIEFKHKETNRAGALISGEKSERYKAKCEIAVIINQKDIENERNPEKPKPKPKPLKRPNVPIANNPWMKPKKKK